MIRSIKSTERKRQNAVKPPLLCLRLDYSGEEKVWNKHRLSKVTESKKLMIRVLDLPLPVDILFFGGKTLIKSEKALFTFSYNEIMTITLLFQFGSLLIF